MGEILQSPEHAFEPSGFDASFFADYEAQLADISLEDQASAALQDILAVKRADDSEKTYEEIRDESAKFFENEWVQQSEALMNQMVREFAMACMGHDHGSELAQDGSLGSIFEKGVEQLYGKKEHSHEDKKGKDEDEIDPKTGKKRRKKRK